MSEKQFYIKFVKKGRTYFVDGLKYQKKGVWGFVSADKVKRSKKKVVNYSVPEKRIKQPLIVSKITPKNDFGEKVIDSDIFSQSVNRSIINDNKAGQKIGIKYKGKIYEIDLSTPEKIKGLTDLTDEIQNRYFNSFKGLTESPILFIGYIKGKKGTVIDYDSTLIGSDGEVGDEFPEEFKSFRMQIGRILSNYLKK